MIAARSTAVVRARVFDETRRDHETRDTDCRRGRMRRGRRANMQRVVVMCSAGPTKRSGRGGSGPQAMSCFRCEGKYHALLNVLLFCTLRDNGATERDGGRQRQTDRNEKASAKTVSRNQEYLETIASSSEFKW
jgi:hypothetical protein